MSTSTVALRLPTALANQLKSQAALHNVSVNAEIGKRLFQSVNMNEFVADMFSRINLTVNVFRIEPRSTTYDLASLKMFFETHNIDKIILGSREDNINNAVLIVIIHTNYATFILDDTSLNMARPPRSSEIEDLLTTLDEDGLMPIVEYIEKPVEDTRDYEASVALDMLIDHGSKRLIDLNSIRKILKNIT